MAFKEQLLHFLKFSGVSVLSTILEYILFYFLTPFLNQFMAQPLADGLSTAICYLFAAILCFVLNKFFVFKSQNNGFKEMLKFFAVAAPKMLITTFTVPAVTAILQTTSSIIKTSVNVIIQTILFFAGYIFQKIWVFKGKEKE